MWHGDGMGWWMVWGGLMMMLFWGAIITLVVWAVRTLAHGEADGGQPTRTAEPLQTPLDIAKQRYARGDISRDEFGLIKKDLEGS